MEKVEFWLLIDGAGDYVVAKDEEALGEAWSDDIGGVPLNSRAIKLTLNVALPTPVHLSAIVPAEQVGPITLTAE